MTLDYCGIEAGDWADLVRQIALESRKISEPVLALGVDAERIDSAEVDGEPASFDLLPGGGIVRLTALPDRRAEARVRFRPVSAGNSGDGAVEAPTEVR